MGKTANFRELREIELSVSGVDSFVKKFDYSEQEWAEIELCAQPARTGPLTVDVRQCLRQAGAVYLTLNSVGRGLLKRQELILVAKRENIRRLAAELHELLFEANTTTGEYKQLLKSLARLRNDPSVLSGN